MNVTIEDLRVLCAKLLRHLEEQGHESIELTADYYWELPEKARYDMTCEPSLHTVGQLTDDWKELRKVLDGTGEPISYQLVWLAAILRIIGERTVT